MPTLQSRENKYKGFISRMLQLKKNTEELSKTLEPHQMFNIWVGIKSYEG